MRKGDLSALVSAMAEPNVLVRSGAAMVLGQLRKGHDVLIDHLTARERRIESSTTVKDLLTRVIERRAVTMPRRAGAAFRPAPAVPMMVRRLPAPAAQDAPKPASPPRPRDDWTTPAAPKLTQTAPTPIPLTPSELGRLTEHVVGALDRKFTAHRERFGSI